MFILKNYNRFLVGTEQSFQWENFRNHRFPEDIKKLVTFASEGAAQDFLDRHPEIEKDFEAWIVPLRQDEWIGSLTVP